MPVYRCVKFRPIKRLYEKNFNDIFKKHNKVDFLIDTVIEENVGYIFADNEYKPKLTQIVHQTIVK